jgi:hypothetical protein
MYVYCYVLLNVYVSYVYVFTVYFCIYCMFMYLHLASWHSSATLTEVFLCFFLSCKANAREKPAKMGHGLHSSKNLCVVLCSVCFVSFNVLFVCKYVLYCCHRVATQLQFNKYIIYPIISIRQICDPNCVLKEHHYFVLVKARIRFQIWL